MRLICIFCWRPECAVKKILRAAVWPELIRKNAFNADNALSFAALVPLVTIFALILSIVKGVAFARICALRTQLIFPSRRLLITDGPPGVGCPVIASIGGASHLLIVTEPTVSGLHDMQRVAELANHFKVPASVCINKCDLNPDAAGAIAWNAESMGMAVIGQIPFDAAFTRAMIAGQTLMEHDAASKVAEGIRAMWQKLEQKIKAGAPKTAPISDKRIN